jgi:hypothetical protein
MLKKREAINLHHLMLVEFKFYHVNFNKHTAKPIDSNSDFECLSAAVANPLRAIGVLLS